MLLFIRLCLVKLINDNTFILEMEALIFIWN